MTAMRHFPLDGSPHRPQVGLRPLDLNEWIELDESTPAELGQKRELVQHHPDVVLRVRPAANDACLELYELLRDHLLRRFPGHLQMDPHDGSVTVTGTGRRFAPPMDGERALAQMAEWVSEDVCLLSATPPVRLEAGCVCFPSRWSLADKMDLPSDAIHAPVPKFAAIAGPTTAFLEKLQTHRPMSRMNWTLHDSDALFAPHPPATPGPPIPDDEVLARTFLRVERQTLRRLPRTGFVVFTIRTYVTRLLDVAADPQRRRLLGDTVRGLTEDVARYKGMIAFWDALKRVL